MASEREHLWRRRVVEQRTSGLTVRAFCQRHELREPSFYFWRRTLAERDRAGSLPAEPVFVAVAVPPVPPPAVGPAAVVEVHLPCGVRVSVTPGCAAGHLAMVLAVLEGRPC